uniref:Mbt repeat protein n=1 Tax=Pithovirus LCPAC404 TaxID=2506597 RepID=A0A481ZGA6_9VIRU|nr:MAG: mbt repeat protein [Pithovirus LCPAC404]
MTDSNIPDTVETPVNVGCQTPIEHRKHYFKYLREFLIEDCSNIIVDFLVYPYFRIGDKIDIFYQTGHNWWVGFVCEEKTDDSGIQRVNIHYIGWDNQWNEWLDRDSDSVQPAGWHTAGKVVVGGKLLKDRSSDANLELIKRGDILADNFDLGVVTIKNDKQVTVCFSSNVEDVKTYSVYKTTLKNIAIDDSAQCLVCDYVSEKSYYCLKCGTTCGTTS